MLQRTSFESIARRYCERQDQTPAGLLDVLHKQRDRLNPDGWFLGECQTLDSSLLGSLTIYPFGPQCEGFKLVPVGPYSPRGLASDMSVAVEWFPAADLPVLVTFQWEPPPKPAKAKRRK